VKAKQVWLASAVLASTITYSPIAGADEFSWTYSGTVYSINPPGTSCTNCGTDSGGGTLTIGTTTVTLDGFTGYLITGITGQ
jgi:hypothetical protein